MKFMLTVPVLALSMISGTAMADQRNGAVVGAIIGSAAGAAIGHHMSGRDGAVVGGAIGAATGVAVATSGNRSQAGSPSARDDYIYRDDDRDYDRRYERETVRIIYREPVVRERVVYREQPVVVYRPVKYVVRETHIDRGYRDKGWHKGHYKHRDRDDDGHDYGHGRRHRH